MKLMKFNLDVEQYRILEGLMRSNPGDPFGAFMIPFKGSGLGVISDNGELSGWEHVSVSTPYRCPTWEEMAFIKSLFWDEEETVIQYHPPRSQYVNKHRYCLHLWRKVGFDMPLPPKNLLG